MAPTLGLLTLDINLSDVPGCAGSDHTYRHPVLREVMRGVSVDVLTDTSRGCSASVVEAALALERRGATLIVGDCGFLLRHQRLLSERLAVPCVSSALLLLPLLEAIVPGTAEIGVLTYRADTLDAGWLRAAGASTDRVRVAGVERCPAWQHLMVPGHCYPYAALEAELLGVTRALLAERPRIGALLIECTVMPPFARTLQQLAGLPAYDITLLADMLAAGLAREAFALPEDARV